MYAIVKDRGHQYKVREGEVVRVAKLDQDAGAEVVFENVLLVGDGAEIKVGTPTLGGARVTGILETHAKDKKVIASRRIRTNKHVTRLLEEAPPEERDYGRMDVWHPDRCTRCNGAAVVAATVDAGWAIKCLECGFDAYDGTD